MSPKAIFNAFISQDIEFFSGVPDSLLKNFCSYLDDNTDDDNHVISANEGSAVAISIGYHLATSKVPLVYMQNSGLGNAINPLLSLADEKVYSIPMILMIGWRGEPGIKDEPQHIKQGLVTRSMLESMEIKTILIDKNSHIETIIEACNLAKNELRPVALLVKKNTFSKYQSNNSNKLKQFPLRERIINIIAAEAEKYSYSIVSTTGVTSRELFEYRSQNLLDHSNDFLTVGGMGHASQIALGLAMFNKKNILCLDGDGAFLMHMGAAAEIGVRGLKNFKHILINNECHDSVGGQPTRSGCIDLSQVASSLGYRVFKSCNSIKELENCIEDFLICNECSFMEIKSSPGFRKDLGRPTSSPKENKICFMESLQN